jgi:alkylation response protein AidB-like acyl-CoA dehydrogenase
MRTRAEREGDGWRINGTKTFISNGPVGDLAVLVHKLRDMEAVNVLFAI